MGDLNHIDKDRLGEVEGAIFDIGRRTITTLVGLQVGPAAGAAVGVALAAAYILYRKRKELSSKGLRGEYKDLVEIRMKLNQLYARREELVKALEYAQRPSQRRMIMSSLESTDSMIRDLEEMLELQNIIIEAKERIQTILGEKNAREIDKIIKSIEKGEEPAETIYKLLAQVSERVMKTEKGIENLRIILGGGYP